MLFALVSQETACSPAQSCSIAQLLVFDCSCAASKPAHVLHQHRCHQPFNQSAVCHVHVSQSHEKVPKPKETLLLACECTSPRMATAQRALCRRRRCGGRRAGCWIWWRRCTRACPGARHRPAWPVQASRAPCSIEWLVCLPCWTCCTHTHAAAMRGGTFLTRLKPGAFEVKSASACGPCC